MPHREIILTPDPIDESALVSQRSLPKGQGAVLTFIGMVREFENQQPIAGLEYEAFLEMAEHQFNLLLDQALARWPISSIRIHHRLGFVPAQQASLWIETICPHRGEAFQATEWLIHEMKQKVPIWKKVVPSPPQSPSNSLTR